METPPIQYRPLTGRAVRRQGFLSVTTTRSRLYLADDHMLCVDSQGYSEDYRRFYFRDIQAVILQKTNKGRIINIVAVSLFLVIAIPGLFAGSPAMLWVLGIASLFLIALVINTFLGPTCVCQFQTAVQTHDLPSFSRIPRTRKVLERLRPLIQMAQPVSTPAAGRMRDETYAPPASTASPADGLIQSSAPTEPINPA